MFTASRYGFVFTACLLTALSCGTAPAAADGLFNRIRKTPPSPIERAIDEVENRDAPVSVISPAEVGVADIETYEPVATDLPPPPVPDSRIVEVQDSHKSFFGLSVGMYDPLRRHRKLAFNAEFQPGVRLAGVLQPLFGAMVSTDGAMMGYGGLGAPIHLGKRVFVMPSVAVGAYKSGAGWDLGQTIAYRLGAEVAYVFDDQSRLGLGAHVITNGRSINGHDSTGMIALTYTMPVDFMSGH